MKDEAVFDIENCPGALIELEGAKSREVTVNVRRSRCQLECTAYALDGPALATIRATMPAVESPPLVLRAGILFTGHCELTCFRVAKAAARTWGVGLGGEMDWIAATHLGRDAAQGDEKVKSPSEWWTERLCYPDRFYAEVYDVRAPQYALGIWREALAAGPVLAGICPVRVLTVLQDEGSLGAVVWVHKTNATVNRLQRSSPDDCVAEIETGKFIDTLMLEAAVKELRMKLNRKLPNLIPESQEKA